MHKYISHKVTTFKTCKQNSVPDTYFACSICIPSKNYYTNLRFSPNDHFKINITFISFTLSYALVNDMYYNQKPHLNDLEYGLYVKNTPEPRRFLIEFLSISEYHEPTNMTNMPNVPWRQSIMNGVYPTHCRYFTSSITNISWHLSPFLHSSINLFYQVIESDLISKQEITFFVMDNWLIENQAAGVIIFRSQLSIGSENSVEFHTFVIVTERMKVLLLTPTPGKFIQIYDGPDVNCQELITEAILTVSTKSYQATVLSNHSTYSGIVRFNSSIGHHTIYSISEISDNTLKQFPSKACIKNGLLSCIINVQSVPPLGINITVVSLIYTGPSVIGDQCLYGGIAIDSRDKNGTFSQLMIECQDIDDAKYNISGKLKTQPIFSSLDSKELWISISAYKPYSSVSGILSISASYCKYIDYQKSGINNSMKLSKANLVR